MSWVVAPYGAVLAAAGVASCSVIYFCVLPPPHKGGDQGATALIPAPPSPPSYATGRSTSALAILCSPGYYKLCWIGP